MDGEKEREYRRVTPEFAQRVIETGRPHGQFWFIEGDLFVAIDSRTDEVFCEDFADMGEMKKWFACKTCVNASGFELF